MSFGSPYMTIPKFSYLKPNSISEAIELLEKYGDDAKVKAGGIGIIAFMKERLTSASYLVDLKGIPELGMVQESDGYLRIGATVTLRRLEEMRNLKLMALHEAVSSIADPIIRQSATLVGDTCEAIPWVDAPPALISLGAYAHVAGKKGTRDIPVSQLIKGTGELSIDSGEIITGISIPESGGNSTYVKFSSGSEYSIASASVNVNPKSKELTIVMGAVAESPRIFNQSTVEWKWGESVEKNIRGVWKTFDDRLEPMSDMLSSSEFRMKISKMVVARALKDLFGGA
ncbi:MAG: FAD binding domain-containing protein [Nitrososphaerota archaeon]|jgi:carbon-monoxide dehydrogenase medium subunit|nr:FAD binding domain-containing protein [Nitrososphaerota archaeon]MDG6930325.1 FAD binding domain-containing protein [Nitrososphaerota archaeon]MDG6931992.1 FAD binding domain-containing protein [Nitrososphaerota archaeon]MDG6936698.1 FAD binding domain-containing protein [Nitrososphaerota archaeon]MDG6944503.1 FAD binding domain-containing protein [Nitrososphaerota archaeon]